MEWEFTPEQVVRGEVDYGLSQFRRDLNEEIQLNLPGLDETELDRLLHLIYDMHYWLATGKNYREFESQFEDQPMTLLLLRSVWEHSSDNVEMLGAILQRLIMDRVEAGMPLQSALDQVAEIHHRAVGALQTGVS